MLLCPIKWWPIKVFPKLHKVLLLIFNILKGAVSAETISDNWKPWKNYESYILFHLNKLNLLLADLILLILCIFIKSNVWYLWSLKILAIKMVSVQFCKKFNRTVILWCIDQKRLAFSRHLFWERPSKYCMLLSRTFY